MITRNINQVIFIDFIDIFKNVKYLKLNQLIILLKHKILKFDLIIKVEESLTEFMI